MESNSISPKDSSELTDEILETASEAGRIMLESGSEISRVEETMHRIAASYGETQQNIFVIGNGIFLSHQGQATIQYVPIKFSRLDKVVEANQLVRVIEKQHIPIASARSEIERINNLKPKPAWEQMMAAILSAIGFNCIFTGTFMDGIAAVAASIVLWAFTIWISAPYLSKALKNILGGIIGTTACVMLHRMGFGDNLGNMLASTLILLVPGVAFTNGIRDIASEHYLAGITRLIDALMAFFCLSMGSCIVFLADGILTGDPTPLSGISVNPQTYPIFWQALGAFVGTTAFAIIYNVPRRFYASCGIAGLLCWVSYILTVRYTSMGIAGGSLVGGLVVAFLSSYLARAKKCPSTVFLICGNFPLIPGIGIFFTAYYAVSRQFRAALDAGITALGTTIAIVLAMIIVSNLVKRKGVKGLKTWKQIFRKQK